MRVREDDGPFADVRGERRLSFELKGRIDRGAFGLVWNMPLGAGGFLGDEEVELRHRRGD